MDKTGRPISPHIFIYRFPTIAWSSVVVRATGIVLTIGTSGIALLSLGDSSKPAELASWVEEALSLKPKAGSQVAQRLFAAGLTHARMVAAVAHPGGFQSLCDLLSRGNVGMRPGDALALASASMSDAGK